MHRKIHVQEGAGVFNLGRNFSFKIVVPITFRSPAKNRL